MGTDEFHEHAAECKGHVDHQPAFVAAEIKDDPIVAHEIDGAPELALYLGRIYPMRRGLERPIITIPVKDWEAFETWADRPPQRIAALEKLARTEPKWRK